MKTLRESFILWTLFISLLLHCCLLPLFFKEELKNTKSPPIWIEWQGIDNRQSHIGRTQTEDVRTGHISQALKKALRTDWDQLSKETLESAITHEIHDVNIAAEGIELNLEKSFRDDLELPLLWRQIRLYLRYRPEHALARLDGDVQVRIRIDRNGQLLRIFKESAIGSQELLGWTILCLLEAFSKPFLKQPLHSSRTLDLRVQFTMGRKVASSIIKSARMIFVVEGDRYTGSDPEERVDKPKGHLEPPPNPMRVPTEVKLLELSTKHMMNIFRDKTLTNHMEWNYFTQADYYKDQCHRHGNKIACEKLKTLQKTVGD